jgi:hypothetical protein
MASLQIFLTTALDAAALRQEQWAL